jgi:hypothetical protein
MGMDTDNEHFLKTVLIIRTVKYTIWKKLSWKVVFMS